MHFFGTNISKLLSASNNSVKLVSVPFTTDVTIITLSSYDNTFKSALLTNKKGEYSETEHPHYVGGNIIPRIGDVVSPDAVQGIIFYIMLTLEVILE